MEISGRNVTLVFKFARLHGQCDFYLSHGLTMNMLRRLWRVHGAEEDDLVAQEAMLAAYQPTKEILNCRRLLHGVEVVRGREHDAAVKDDVYGMYRIVNGDEDCMNVNGAIFRVIPYNVNTQVSNRVMSECVRNKLAMHPILTIDAPTMPIGYIDI